jgi:hypothetical protein
MTIKRRIEKLEEKTDSKNETGEIISRLHKGRERAREEGLPSERMDPCEHRKAILKVLYGG